MKNDYSITRERSGVSAHVDHYACAHPHSHEYEYAGTAPHSNANTAVNRLVRTYNAEQRGRTAPNIKFDELAKEAFDNVQFMCEWRLGRAHLEGEGGQVQDLEMEPKTVAEIVACLKRVRKSIEMWQKKGGRRGYFNFVNQFIL
ncbi:MAG: hypothetical protein P8183_10810 [Anaerolineae bacterium]